MAKNIKYVCKVQISVGNSRTFNKGQIMSSANVKKPIIEGLLKKGYIEEYKLNVEEAPKKVKVTTKNVDNTKTKAGEANEVTEDDEKTGDDINIDIDPDDVVGE